MDERRTSSAKASTALFGSKIERRIREARPLVSRARRSMRAIEDFGLHVFSVPIVHTVESPVIGSDEARRVLAEADWDEVEALICNPYGNDKALYERRKTILAIR